MKLLTKLNTYKASNNEIKIDPKTMHITAWSYDWWKYIQTDSAGNIVMLATKYSVSTSRHQSDARSIMRRLNIKPSLILYKTTNSGGGYYGRAQGTIKQAITSEISYIKNNIRKNIAAIRRKGSKRNKNSERREEIKSMWYRIKDLRNYRDNYIDQKLIPRRRPSNKELFGYTGYKKSHWIRLGYETSIVRTVNHLKRNFFKKQNGRYDYNGLAEFIYIYGVYSENTNYTRENIAPLVEILGKHATYPIISSRYSLDIIRMIPNRDLDPRGYNRVISWIKHNLNETVTLFDLDKLHTYLLNKQNRRTYAPSEPVAVPLHSRIKALDGLKDIRLVKTVADMRKEGRSQSHCIGSKHYIDSLFRGYQALNYKGYTFYLDPNLNIIETKGSHNRYTPTNIQNELLNLLNQTNKEV